MNPMLVKEYDEIYRLNPLKWSGNGRDNFAFEMMQKYGKPVSLLDIGCGNGHTIKYLHNKWKTTDYYGIELSGEAIKIAKEECPYATFIKGDVDSLRLDKRFDRITVMGVMEHFPDPTASLRKIRGWLEWKGLMYVEAPNCLAYSKDKEEGFRRTNYAEALQTEWHLKRDTWEKIIRDAGFTIIRAIVGMYVETEFVWILKRKIEDVNE